jgi:hypothetical protein
LKEQTGNENENTTMRRAVLQIKSTALRCFAAVEGEQHKPTPLELIACISQLAVFSFRCAFVCIKAAERESQWVFFVGGVVTQVASTIL